MEQNPHAIVFGYVDDEIFAADGQLLSGVVVEVDVVAEIEMEGPPPETAASVG